MVSVIYKILLSVAKCAVDLGDGSERGEYVNQDYILDKLGRPHRAISLMYCYYPYDEGWPGRASKVHARDDISFAWDYPYDDYFPYQGGIGGNPDGEPFEFMREIRRRGQDINLTLTMDPRVDNAHIRAIAQELRPFGRLILRLNHEATGTWFSFNRRCTYQEVADFFVRALHVFRECAPNIKLVLCIGGIEKLGDTQIEKEEEFAQAVRETDIWSVDKYMALHWGWPYDIAETGGSTHKRDKVEEVFKLAELSYKRFRELNNGVGKPFTLAEMNADGDVTGPWEQAEMMHEFYTMVEQKKAEWISGITMYQFRDRGRLGLEIEDPCNPNHGFEQPLLKVYKELISRAWFSPVITDSGETSLPIILRWGGSEDAEGIRLPLTLEKNPVFCELYFKDSNNYMIEFAGKWFYRAPEAKRIDLMPAFYEKPLDGLANLSLHIFAPPASGKNDLSISDGDINCYTEIKELPEIRIRYRATEE